MVKRRRADAHIPVQQEPIFEIVSFQVLILDLELRNEQMGERRFLALLGNGCKRAQLRVWQFFMLVFRNVLFEAQFR